MSTLHLISSIGLSQLSHEHKAAAYRVPRLYTRKRGYVASALEKGFPARLLLQALEAIPISIPLSRHL